jgi:hypothetical protein
MNIFPLYKNIQASLISDRPQRCCRQAFFAAMPPGYSVNSGFWFNIRVFVDIPDIVKNIRFVKISLQTQVET